MANLDPMTARRQAMVCIVVAALVGAQAAGLAAVRSHRASGSAGRMAAPSHRLARPAGAGQSTPCPDPEAPETVCRREPSSADETLGLDSGPPVFAKPAYTFGEPWAACEAQAEQGLSEWDGCDPFAGEAAYFHYDKPYGTPEEAAALVVWEPGRFERGYDGYAEHGNYYQSDQWRGPVSVNDGYYGGQRDGRYCGGAYVQDARYAAPGGGEEPAPFFGQRGYGGQGCT